MIVDAASITHSCMSAIVDTAPDWTMRVADALAHGRAAIVPDVLPGATVRALREHALALEASGQFHPARIGHHRGRHLDAGVRGDRIAWLSCADDMPAERAYCACMEALRQCLNRELMLGLVELEAHYALYPSGAAYARHRDTFRDDDARVVSVIVYLNDAWTAAEGGALRLHVSASHVEDVLPVGGTLAAFASQAFEHEVLPATRPRLAIAGWLRRRARVPW